MREKNNSKIMVMAGYSERLRIAMDRSQFSQSSLARRIGISQPEISYYLKGHSFPRIPVAQKIAFELKCSYSWLSYGINPLVTGKYFYPLHEFWFWQHERISYLAWTRGIAQIDLVRECPYSTCSQWFSGERLISENAATWLTQRLNCKATFLLNDWYYSNTEVLFQREVKQTFTQEYERLFSSVDVNQIQDDISAYCDEQFHRCTVPPHPSWAKLIAPSLE